MAKYLVSCGEDGAVNLWNWETKKYTRTFTEHSSNVLSVAISPDSRILVSGGLDGIKVWDLQAARPLYNFAVFNNPTYTVAVGADNQTLASGGRGTNIKLWNLKTGKLISGT